MHALLNIYIYNINDHYHYHYIVFLRRHPDLNEIFNKTFTIKHRLQTAPSVTVTDRGGTKISMRFKNNLRDCLSSCVEINIAALFR